MEFSRLKNRATSINKIELYGHIKEGKLILNNRKRFEQDLKGFKDCAVEMIIKKKNRRSNPQNRYYWGVVVGEIVLRMRELGNEVDSETVHEFLKAKFNPVQIHDTEGTVIAELPGSTTEMNKEEFGEYLDKIIPWAAEMLDLQIPYPNEKLEFQF